MTPSKRYYVEVEKRTYLKSATIVGIFSFSAFAVPLLITSPSHIFAVAEGLMCGAMGGFGIALAVTMLKSTHTIRLPVSQGRIKEELVK